MKNYEKIGKIRDKIQSSTPITIKLFHDPLPENYHRNESERVITRLPRILCFQPTHALEGAEREKGGTRERERVIVVRLEVRVITTSHVKRAGNGNSSFRAVACS